MGNDRDIRPLERVLLTLLFIDEQLSLNPDKETFEYSLVDWAERHPLFADRNGVERAFSQIEKDSHHRISAKIVTEEFLVNDPFTPGAAEARKVLKKVDRVTFFVESKNAIQECLSLIKAKIADKKSETGFVVTYEGRQCIIRLAQGPNNLSIQLKQKGRPYQIVNLLRERSMTTRDLAETLVTNQKAVSDAISDTREKITNRLGVDGKLFFENIDDRHFLKRTVFPQ
jgi:hypothetical protein